MYVMDKLRTSIFISQTHIKKGRTKNKHDQKLNGSHSCQEAIAVMLISLKKWVKEPVIIGHNGRMSWYQEISYCSSSQWLEKASWTSSHLLTMKNNLSFHNLNVEEAAEQELHKPL